MVMLVIVDIAAYQALMTMNVKVIGKKVVIKCASAMVILIVVICGIVVELPEVLRSSRIASEATTSRTPLSWAAPTPTRSSIASFSRSRFLLVIYKFNNLKVVCE